MFIRFVTDRIDDDTDKPFGVFGAAYDLLEGASLADFERSEIRKTLDWFETKLLTREENLVGLMALNRDLLAQSELLDDTYRVVLDMDSSESPVHGQQEGSAYNGHFASVC